MECHRLVCLAGEAARGCNEVGRWRGRRRGEHGDCRWGGESGSSDGSIGGVVDTISHRHGPRHDPRQQPLPRANPSWETVHFISKVVVRDVGIFHRPNEMNLTRQLRVTRREETNGLLVVTFQLFT